MVLLYDKTKYNMIHLKKVIAKELSLHKAGELAELSGDLSSAVSKTLMNHKTGKVDGVLHKLLDELWTMVVDEQRRKMQELKNEEHRFMI